MSAVGDAAQELGRSNEARMTSLKRRLTALPRVSVLNEACCAWRLGHYAPALLLSACWVLIVGGLVALVLYVQLLGSSPGPNILASALPAALSASLFIAVALGIRGQAGFSAASDDDRMMVYDAFCDHFMLSWFLNEALLVSGYLDNPTSLRLKLAVRLAFLRIDQTSLAADGFILSLLDQAAPSSFNSQLCLAEALGLLPCDTAAAHFRTR